MYKRYDEKLKTCSGLLHVACSGGHLPIVRYFVNNGLDNNAEFDDYTPFNRAFIHKHYLITTYLLYHGANVYNAHLD